MTAAQEMKEPPDLTCINVECPQCDRLREKCTAPDPEVCTGTPDGRLRPCPERKI